MQQSLVKGSCSPALLACPIVYESSRRSIILHVPINLVQFASNPPNNYSYELLVLMTALYA